MTVQLSEEDEIEEGPGGWLRRMAQQLSGVTIVVIIAGGVLTFFLLFIFAKRQIMRFTLRTHRGPHVPFGTDASKSLRREIHRRIDSINKITYEPQVLKDNVEENKNLCHFYRMKACDDAKEIEMSMTEKKLGKRQSFESLRSYLIVTLTPQMDPKIIHKFSDMYEAARFNPTPFGQEEYKAFQVLSLQLINGIKVAQPKGSHRSPTKHGMNVVISPKETRGSKVKLSPTPGEKKKSFGGISDLPLIRRVSKHSSGKYEEDLDESLSTPLVIHGSHTGESHGKKVESTEV